MLRFADSLVLGPPRRCKRGMDLAIIMDRSQTIGSKDFEKSRSFVRNLTHRYKVSPRRTRVGIIAYDESAELFVSFRHRKQQNVAAMISIINRYNRYFFAPTRPE